MKRETRVLDIDFRVKRDGESTTFVGVPILYDVDSADIGFIERISRGAASSAVEKSDIRLLYGHNSESLLPLARTASGTLRVSETSTGIQIEADAPDTQFARDLAESIGRGDVSQMSFAFTVEDDKWEERDGKYYRTINEISELYDFSFVAFPAYPDTTVALRSLKQIKTDAIVSTEDDAIVIENEDIDIELILSRNEVKHG